MNRGLFIVFGIYLNGICTDANRRCLECNAVPQPYDCTTVTECGAHEICSIEKYRTNGGIVLFDVGCRDPNLCNANHHPFGRRHVTFNSSEDSKRSFLIGTPICYECCNDKDICNLDGHCGAERFVPPTGARLCYYCPKSTNPGDCNQLKLCDQDSQCSVKQVTNLLAEVRWEIGCSLKSQCQALSQASSSKFCSYCCTDQLCNKNCTTVPTTSPPPTTTSTTPAAKIPAHITNVYVIPANPKYGVTLRIFCEASGTQPLRYEYMVSGQTLPGNANVKNNMLTITNFNPQNEHDYRCYASNAYGTDFRQVKILGHP